MARNTFTFVNHAAFMVRNDSALLLVDPWVEGSAFNNGWSLVDRSTSNAALVQQINETSVPVYLWYTHEHPDHFAVSFVKLLRQEARVRVTCLYQRTLDGRVVNFLRKQGFPVIECVPGEAVALGHDMRLTVFPYSDGDSYGVIQSGGRSLLNLNDCAITTPAQCEAVRTHVAAVAPRIDVLLTQFGYANWVGNPDQQGLHRQAAAEKLERMALQIGMFKPRLVLPFASFVYFSHPENAYLNESQNWPRSIVDAPRLAKLAAGIRFVQPGAAIDLDTDTAASLEATHLRAVAHWMGLKAAGLPLLPARPAVPLAEVRAAFAAYVEKVSAALHGLPKVLELTRRLAPLTVHLADLQQTVRFSYCKGMTVLDRNAAFAVSMSSTNAVFLFSNEYGFDTTHVNGRFRIAQADGLATFSRFFLPQRMGKNGYDRRNPGATLRYLMRNALARASRQWTLALRRRSRAARRGPA